MKKLLIGVLVLFGFIGIAGSANQPTEEKQSLVESTASSTPAPSSTRTTQPAPVAEVEPTPAPTPAPSPAPAAPTPTRSSTSSSTYTNVDGNTVQSPTTSADGSVPSGATAKCRDGIYSFSQNRSGTCSHHGGVGQWL